MQRNEQRLKDDCVAVRTALTVEGEDVPEWIALTAVVQDEPSISEAARDLLFRCGWLVK